MLQTAMFRARFAVAPVPAMSFLAPYGSLLLDPQEGDTGGGSGGGDDGKKGDQKGDDGKKGGGDARYTDADVNRVVAKQKRQWESEKETLLGQMEELKNSANLTKAEKERIAQQIETLEASMSEEQKARRDAEKRNKETAGVLQQTTQERDFWRTNYTKTVKENAILSAAQKHQAFNPDQILRIVMPDVHLEDAKDKSGAVVGHRAVVKVTEKEGESDVEKTYTVDEYLKAMSGKEQFANLFKDGSAGGTGSKGGGGGGAAKRRVTQADLLAGKVNPEDITKGLVVVVG